MSNSKGLRYNQGKLKTNLLPPEWELALTKVLHQGDDKYNPDGDRPHNWIKGIPDSVCYGSAKRHLLKFVSGEETDSETGCSHLVHAAWNLLAMYSYRVRGVAEQDLRVFSLPSADLETLLTTQKIQSK